MDQSRIVEGSRFYVPRLTDPAARYIFTLLHGETISVKPHEINCFEMLALPGTLRDFVVIHRGARSHVILETKEEVITTLDASEAADESTL